MSDISDVWNLISESIVGMSTSDPRWERAVKWLNDNRQHQKVIARLPVKDIGREKESARQYLLGFKHGCDTNIDFKYQNFNK
jgi:hypothetical protein